VGCDRAIVGFHRCSALSRQQLWGGDEIEILTKPGSASAFTEKKTVRRPNLQLAQTNERLPQSLNCQLWQVGDRLASIPKLSDLTVIAFPTGDDAITSQFIGCHIICRR
jgi:hypothetical protein